MQTHKKRKARILSLALSVVMMIPMLSTTAFATESDREMRGITPAAGVSERAEVQQNQPPSTPAKSKTSREVQTAARSSANKVAAVHRTVQKSRAGTLNVSTDEVYGVTGNLLVPIEGVYDMLDTEGWKWDTNNKTLTLSGANINGGTYSAIMVSSGTTIVLKGENHIVSEGSQGLQMVNTTGDLTIAGTGVLDVSGKYSAIVSGIDDTSTCSIKITGGTIRASGEVGDVIWALGGSLKISGAANVTAAGGSLCALVATDDITIADSAVVSATTEGQSANAVYTDGEINIKDTADVTAKSNTSFCGLQAKDGITVSGGTVDAFSKADIAIYSPAKITVSGAADVTAEGKISGIRSRNTLEISGGTVIAKGETAAVEGGTLSLINVAAKYKVGSEYTGATNISGNKIYEGETQVTEAKDIKIAKSGYTGIQATAPSNIPVSKTDTQIVLEAVTVAGETVEYAISTSNAAPTTGWQDSTVFQGLTANTQYYFFARVKANTTHEAGTASSGTAITTDKSQVIPPPGPDPHVHTPAADDGDCTTPILCTGCGAVMTPANPHNFSGTWQKDGSEHWHGCTNSGCAKDADRAAHTWDSGMVTTPPTIEQEGTKTFTCTACSQTKTEPIEKLPSKEEIEDPETGSKIEYEDGTPFDETVELIVTPQPQKENDKYAQAVDKAAKGLTIAELYDVKLLKDGAEIQPGGKLKLTLKLTKAMKAMTKLQVIYIDDQGKVTIIPSQVKEDQIVFTTDHFSYYGVIGKEVKKPTPPAPTKIAAPKSGKTKALSPSSVRVTWSKVSKAQGYAVYRATSKTGKYTLVKKLKGNTTDIGGLKANKTYYFKIRAKGEAGYGGYSKAASAKTRKACPCGQDHSKAWFKLKQSGKSTVKVTWTPQKSAKSYQVANNHTSSKAMKIKWTGNNRQHCYLSLGKSKGKNYQFKMRTVTVKNGKKVYGPWTSKVCITMK